MENTLLKKQLQKDRLLDKAARTHMMQWNLTAFKRRYRRLYHTIMQAMEEYKEAN